jgi:hypothetical protein
LVPCTGRSSLAPCNWIPADTCAVRCSAHHLSPSLVPCTVALSSTHPLSPSLVPCTVALCSTHPLSPSLVPCTVSK